jgi:hypothetical protein
MKSITTFSVADQIKEWAASYKGHTGIKFYLSKAEFEFDPGLKTVFIIWPEFVEGANGSVTPNYLGMEARSNFPIIYQAMRETNQRVFPDWLDPYSLTARFGPDMATFRSPIASCEDCHQQH